jgi:hypothetical protein
MKFSSAEAVDGSVRLSKGSPVARLKPIDVEARAHLSSLRLSCGSVVAQLDVVGAERLAHLAHLFRVFISN